MWLNHPLDVRLSERDLKLIVIFMLWDVGVRLAILALLFSPLFILYFPNPSWVRQTGSYTRICSDSLNQHEYHLILTPLAGFLPPASNSAFNISQPKAGHQQWSCHAVLSEQTLPPQTLSACKAPVIQPWNLPTSQTRSSKSPLSPPPHPCFHYLSFTLLLSVFEHLSIPTFSTDFPQPLLLHSLPPPLPSPPMTSCQGPRDSLSCRIPAAVLMILPPGPDQPEKYSYHFSTEWELSPLQLLCEICVNLPVTVCVVHKHLDLILTY